MAKYVVVYFDGGRLRNAGSAEALPADARKAGKGVWETGSLADGAPAFVEVLDEEYVPEEG
jgi:hypothetical protein